MKSRSLLYGTIIGVVYGALIPFIISISYVNFPLVHIILNPLFLLTYPFYVFPFWIYVFVYGTIGAGIGAIFSQLLDKAFHESLEKTSPTPSYCLVVF